MLARADVLAALRDCYDTEVQVNIVDLGLVESIEIAAEPDSARPLQQLKVALILTAPPAITDPAGAFLIEQVRNRLAGLAGVDGVEVKFVDQPLWTAQRISEAGRRQLRI